MAYLQDHGYRVVTLDEVRNDLLGRQRLPRRSVAITFDDGAANNHCNAFPILRRHGFSATVFLVAGAIGEKREKPGWPEAAARYLNAAEIAEMTDSGIGFGSHTLTHVRLAQLEPKQAEREIVESKRLIEQLTGRVRLAG